MSDVNSFEAIMASTFPGEEAQAFSPDDGPRVNVFEDIVGNLITGNTVGLGELMTAAESSAAAVEQLKKAHPYIASDTALYRVGLALEEAYLSRHLLVDESLAPNSDAYTSAVAEHNMTIKRRNLFRRVCNNISTEIKFNRDPEVRFELFDITVVNTTQEILEEERFKEITPDTAAELIELTEHIGMLCKHGVSQHFQTV